MKRWWSLPVIVLACGAGTLLYLGSMPARILYRQPEQAVKKNRSMKEAVPAPGPTLADRILIQKDARRMTLLQEGKPLKTYRIALGFTPAGRKTAEGDGRTPEGCYVIDRRNAWSRFHKALHISYPNHGDRMRAAALGVSPGGEVMIHGLKNGDGRLGKNHRRRDWTNGCIAVTNEEIEEIWRLVPDGAVVEIVP